MKAQEKPVPKYWRALRPYLVTPDTDPNFDGEYPAWCPLCEWPKGNHKTPSASFNFSKGVWSCFKKENCSGGGSLKGLKTSIDKGTSKPNNVIDLRPKVLPDPQQVKGWHDHLLGYKGAHAIFFQKRGLSMKEVKRRKIGYNASQSRYTVPIPDEEGTIVNVRRYRLGAKRQKMLNWVPSGGSQEDEKAGIARLYPIDVLAAHDEIVLVEGEFDALILEQNGIPAVTTTAGAGTWSRELSAPFVGKTVYLCFDDDDTGRRGEKKVLDALRNVAHKILKITLNLIIGKDATDFFVENGNTAKDFRNRMNDAEVLFEKEPPHEVPTAGLPIPLHELQEQRHLGEVINVTAVVSAKMPQAHTLPKTLKVACRMTAGAACNFCPVGAHNGDFTVDLPADDERIMQFTGKSDTATQDRVKKISGAMCTTHAEFSVAESYVVEEMEISSAIGINDNGFATIKPASSIVYAIGTNTIDINQLVTVVGKTITDPRDNRMTFMAWNVALQSSDIDTFVVDKPVNKELAVFEVGEQSVLEKCTEISRDMAANVTHIYNRDWLHIGMDLVFHSVLSFKFRGIVLPRGWCDVLVLGDTRTGKSAVGEGLARHYGAGQVYPCESATFSGLVGGTRQTGSRNDWLIKLGAIPMNDRRLLILDEFTGLLTRKPGADDVISKMSSMRSSGHLKIASIAGETDMYSRTRLTWLGNTNNGQQLSDVPGIHAIPGLFKNPEDVARFDFAMAVASADIPDEVFRSSTLPSAKHRYESRLCHDLIMWAWSRQIDQVIWEPGVEADIVKLGNKMADKYDDSVPLVQRADITTKLARIAVAFAVRTHSASKDGESVIVKRGHVEATASFLKAIYSAQAMGYASYSKEIKEKRGLCIRKLPEAERTLRNDRSGLRVLKQNVNRDSFRSRDLQEALMGNADELMNRLWEWGAIVEAGRDGWKFRPEFRRMLKTL